MATYLDLDPRLVERVLEASGEKTKKAAVTRALEEFLARREQSKIVELFGNIDWDPDYDYKGDRFRSWTRACGPVHCRAPHPARSRQWRP